MPLPYLPEKIWNYTPVLHAFPVPAIAAYDQAPNLCLQVSEALVPYLLGLLEIYTYQDKWEGTPTEKAQAIGVIHDLRAALCIAGPCPPAPGGDMFSLRLENCVLQYTNDNGTTWYDVAGWSGGADACFTGSQGAQGPEGTEGPTGPQGPPGTPGQDCDCDVTPPETPGEDGDVKRCNLASYLVDIPLPTSYQKLVAARQGSADIATLIGAALGLAATIVVTVASGGATIPAFLAVGVGLGGGGAALGGVLAERNPTDLTNEATPQFWQDVKCAIYCTLPDNGILTAATTVDCASAVGELTDTYPNAALVVKEMLLASNPEALAQYSVVGALYEGDNCDICQCEEGAGCEPASITWLDTGATPIGWYSLGDVDTTGWAGAVPDDWSGDYTCSRSENQRWFKTGTESFPYIGIKLVFDEPCLISHALMRFGAPAQNTKVFAIAAKLADGSMLVLGSLTDPFPTLNPQNFEVNPDPAIEVIELWFMAKTGAAAGTTIYINQNEVN